MYFLKNSNEKKYLPNLAGSTSCTILQISTLGKLQAPPFYFRGVESSQSLPQGGGFVKSVGKNIKLVRGEEYNVEEY